MHKSHVQQLYQLKQCHNIMKQSSKQLDQMQLTFINLAQQVHHICATVDEIPEPPFDRYHYIWNWYGIIICFCGSNYYFLITFDFSRYISPVCAEYSLIVH